MSRNRSTEFLVNVGRRLLAERTRLDLSQQQMADLGGVSRPSYRLYEEGRREPSLSYLLQLSEHGPDFVYLVFGDATQKRKSPPICLSAESLGVLFDNTLKIIATEHGGELSSSKKRKLFIQMCRIAATTEEDAADVEALAHETREIRG